MLASSPKGLPNLYTILRAVGMVSLLAMSTQRIGLRSANGSINDTAIVWTTTTEGPLSRASFTAEGLGGPRFGFVERMLVDYSDSEDENEPAAPSAPGPALPAAKAVAAPELPPAKKARKEINLQHLLKRNDASLPFEEAAKLPDDFFDSGPPKDAGEEQVTSTKRGWDALSAMLPAPKNAPKGPKASISSLYTRAKPLKRPGVSDAASPAAQAEATSATPSETSATPHSSSLSLPEPVEEEEVSHLLPLTTGSAAPLSAASSTSSLLPKVRVGMYDDEAAGGAEVGFGSAPSGASSSIMYDAPVGPALGPADDTAESAYGMPFDMDDGNVVNVSQAALLKAMGPAKQYARAARVSSLRHHTAPSHSAVHTAPSTHSLSDCTLRMSQVRVCRATQAGGEDRRQLLESGHRLHRGDVQAQQHAETQAPDQLACRRGLHALR